MYNLRGCLARKERQFHDALRYLSRAVRRAPRGGDARFLYDRAQCYADMGLWPEVGERAHTPLLAGARSWTAQCSTFYTVSRTKRSAVSVTRPRVRACAQPASVPQAIDDLTAALEFMPSAPLLYFSRGAAHLQYDSGDTAAAVEDLARAADLCGVSLEPPA